MRKVPLDVKDIEEVLALARAVGANKAIIVTTTGWTEPAEKKAKFGGMDLKLYPIEEALETIIADMWKLCPACEEDCIVMDSNGCFVLNGLIFWLFSLT